MNPIRLISRVFILAMAAMISYSSLNAQRRVRIRTYRPYYSRPVVSINMGIRGGYGYYPMYPPVYRYYPRGVSVGIRVRTLPFGFSAIYVGPRLFYYYNGIYYRPYGKDQYEVAAPPLGAKVPSLPGNAKVTVINGQKYYVANGTYYIEEITDQNDIVYKVVGVNGKLNTGDAMDENEYNDESNDPVQNNNSIQNEDRNSVRIGDRVSELPKESKAVMINKQKYFLDSSGIYYQEVVEGNRIYYEVVGISGDMQ